MGMAARAIGRTGGAAAIAALLLPACGGAGKEERPVAEVYDEKLYRADLMNMVPPGTPVEDSAALARGLIETWARERVLLRKAEENLSAGQKDVERQLREYRESLIVFAYEQALVEQKLDTNISEAGIAAYYADNTANFQLRDNVVRARWFRLRESDERVRRKVEELWRSGDPEKYHELEVLLAGRGATIHDTRDTWLPFSEMQELVPLRPANPTDWLPRQNKVVATDSAGTFYVDLVEHRLKDSASPLDLVRGEIRSILINQRKVQLLERMRNDLFNDAVAKQHVKLN